MYQHHFLIVIRKFESEDLLYLNYLIKILKFVISIKLKIEEITLYHQGIGDFKSLVL